MGLANWVIPIFNTMIVNASGDDLREGYTNLTLFGVILCAIPLILSLRVWFGAFAILDNNLKTIDRKRKEGKSTSQLIEYYDRIHLSIENPEFDQPLIN